LLHLPAYAPLGAAQGSGNASIDMPQLLAKVLIVFLLLFVCLRVLKAVMPRLNGASGGAAGGLVLHSEPLGPKARVQVLDLGLRVVMVAVSGPSITTLATIDDAAEMAELRERYAPKGRKGLARRKGTKAPAQRPSFAQALALTSRQALGRGTSPTAADAVTAPRETTAPAREWEQELAAAMAAPAPQGSHDGDAVLGGALESLRSLRRQVERR
jgi:flagellar biogenesis protein FliO